MTAFRFGLVEFDAETRRLAAVFAVTVLKPTEGRLLACLMSRPDALVRHAELTYAVWADADSEPAEPEVSLRRAVFELRQIFLVVGIPADCIEVVRREGFCFRSPQSLRWRRDLNAGLMEDFLPDEAPIDFGEMASPT